jgi:membrane-bound lytic murein transglycosylase A
MADRVRIGRWAAVAMLATLVACTSASPPKPSGSVVRDQSRWVPVAWHELPGWKVDALQQAWPALLRSCQRPSPEWSVLCRRVQQDTPRHDDQARAWLMQNLRPYRVESLRGETRGLITGYYEPSIEARRQPVGAFRVALYGIPADLATRKPYWTRRQLDTLPSAQAALRGREIAYVADPLDALVLHIQGSGRLRITERDGRTRMTRLAYAGNNGQPYQSVGRWLIDQGELQPGQASWPAIRQWASSNPGRINELLWSNPRYVFFREEPLPDPTLGPSGAQGVALTPGRSIAVDPIRAAEEMVQDLVGPHRLLLPLFLALLSMVNIVDSTAISSDRT